MLQDLYHKFNTKLKQGCRRMNPKTRGYIVWLLSILYILTVAYIITNLFI